MVILGKKYSKDITDEVKWPTYRVLCICRMALCEQDKEQ